VGGSGWTAGVFISLGVWDGVAADARTMDTGGGVGSDGTGFGCVDTGVDGVVWLACSKAVAKACTVAKRCLGSLASAVNTTCSTSSGKVGTFSRKEGGGVIKCLAKISV